MMKIHTTSSLHIASKVKDFLESQKKMVLGVKGVDGEPYTSLLLYVIDDKFNMFFGTCRKFKKYESLKINNTVSVSVVEENIDPQLVVNMHGYAQEIEKDKIEETLRWFTEKNDAKNYLKDMADYTMFKITPTHIRWLDASEGELDIYDLDLDTIHHVD